MWQVCLPLEKMFMQNSLTIHVQQRPSCSEWSRVWETL